MSSYSGKLRPISVLDSSDKCPAQNMMAMGGAGRERNENVKSWEECSDCCRKKSDCKYWTWYSPQSLCVTMTNARSLKVSKKRMSGTRECGGEIILMLMTVVRTISPRDRLDSRCFMSSLRQYLTKRTCTTQSQSELLTPTPVQYSPQMFQFICPKHILQFCDFLFGQK